MESAVREYFEKDLALLDWSPDFRDRQEDMKHLVLTKAQADAMLAYLLSEMEMATAVRVLASPVVTSNNFDEMRDRCKALSHLINNIGCKFIDCQLRLCKIGPALSGLDLSPAPDDPEFDPEYWKEEKILWGDIWGWVENNLEWALEDPLTWTADEDPPAMVAWPLRVLGGVGTPNDPLAGIDLDMILDLLPELLECDLPPDRYPSFVSAAAQLFVLDYRLALKVARLCRKAKEPYKYRKPRGKSLPWMECYDTWSKRFGFFASDDSPVRDDMVRAQAAAARDAMQRALQEVLKEEEEEEEEESMRAARPAPPPVPHKPAHLAGKDSKG